MVFFFEDCGIRDILDNIRFWEVEGGGRGREDYFKFEGILLNRVSFIQLGIIIENLLYF